MNAPFFMNRVLFGQSNLIENGGFDKLSSFMLTPDNYIEDDNTMQVEESLSKDFPTDLPTDLPTTDLSKDLPTTDLPPNRPQKTRYTTREKDSIFWCIYTAINGPPNTAQNLDNLMMNEKKAISDYFNKNPTTLKNINHKVTLAKINEIKCDLMTKRFMEGIESFIPCAIYYKRPIFVVYEEINAYFSFVDKTYVSDDDDDNATDTILIYSNGKRFSLETCKKKTAEFLQNKKCTLLHLQNTERFLSGISNYKTHELETYYKFVFNLHEDEHPRFTKTEFYEKILIKCHTTIKGT